MMIGKATNLQKKPQNHQHHHHHLLRLPINPVHRLITSITEN
jgi:hypothetical protein